MSTHHSSPDDKLTAAAYAAIMNPQVRAQPIRAARGIRHTLTEPPAVQPINHPAWCAHSRCTVDPDLPLDDAVHLSQVVTVDGAITTTGPEDVDVWLHQGAATDDVYLVLDVIGGVRAMFALTTAAAAAGALTQLIAQATTEGAHRS